MNKNHNFIVAQNYFTLTELSIGRFINNFRVKLRIFIVKLEKRAKSHQLFRKGRADGNWHTKLFW
jgi:hypothetical protein